MASALSAKEALFCEYYKILKNPREAAARAGYAFPEQAGMKLLKKLHSRRLDSEEEKRAKDGLLRIAFGSVSDAIQLALFDEKPTKDQLEALDLYMISEIKVQKNGTVEIKFFDRLKALDLLMSESEAGSGSAEPFYRALCEGARNLRKNGGVQDEI